MHNISNIAGITGLMILMALASVCNADDLRQPTSPTGHNKAMVRRYFNEVLDNKQYQKMGQLFVPDFVMHRPDGDLSGRAFIQTLFETGLGPHTFKTTIHDILASGDRVVARVSHRMTFSSRHGMLHSRLGMHDARGKTIQWTAIAIFRIKNSKIAEEWVSFDALGKLLQIGIFYPTRLKKKERFHEQFNQTF